MKYKNDNCKELLSHATSQPAKAHQTTGNTNNADRSAISVTADIKEVVEKGLIAVHRKEIKLLHYH